MNRQHIINQKGEIEFRKNLYLQQVEGKTIFHDEFDTHGIETILQKRMNNTLQQMTELKEKRITLSPYIEIGAERRQRSLVMENDLSVNGAAVDISFDMLKSCEYYKKVFNKSKSPLRICCDANNLPFMSHSIPFIFCYETLHHFPQPTPVTQEIFRVLSPGGRFFFDEEPFKQVFHFSLYKGKKIYSNHSLERSKIKKILDYFFSVKTCNEVEYGIIENDDISLRTWKQALQIFQEKEIYLRKRKFQVNLYNPDSYFAYFAAYLLGGIVSGVCTKTGSIGNGNLSIYNALICPSCGESGDEQPVEINNDSFQCIRCSKTYPIINDVVFLFSYKKLEELYPDIFNTILNNTSK
ncbi:MAG: methyltransferase domain-containing protein [Candidatus Latescibacteria bacterium]|jgi:SAM-dependent methyltransferase|nr:methyltransferase domain-containing protein [Candidatus Latescibacterota bacterium]